MRLLRLLFAPLVVLAAVPSYGQQAPYVDPALRHVLRPAVQQALRAAPAADPQAAAAPAAAGNLAIRRLALFDLPHVALFARIRSAGAVAELIAAGARIGSRVGDIVTAEVPIDRLAELLASPSFAVFEASHNVVLSNDSSMRATRVDLVRRAAGGTWTGSAGRGVIVGVYDTGIDYTHEDFIDAGGQTRILGIWDQTDLGTPPAGFSYGRFCSRSVIQQILNSPASSTLCPQIDISGHGSHVAGTAAGDGSAVGSGGTPFLYAGVAPLADLMVVKGGNGLFTESGIIDGLAWLEQEARALNRPMVVNLSLGGQAGPHDGSRLYEAAIDQLTRPGFIVVLSAGNDGSNLNDRNPDHSEPVRDPTYFHGSGLPGATRDFTIEIPPYAALNGACNDFVHVSLWYEAADAFDISVVRPDGGVVNAPFAQVREQDSPSGNVRIDNGSGGPHPGNNAREAEIRLNDCGSGSPPLAGMWTLRVATVQSVTGKPFHFWMYTQSLGGGSFARGRQGFDNHYVVSSPANARSAITVGAFVTRLCWDSPAKPEGPVCFVTREELGDIARFSSAGPTRDGRLKPEITAPGLAVVSTKSANASPAANRIMSGGVHWATQGTSMAAPQVAGAIALLLERQPSLTPDEIKGILAAGSDNDRFTVRAYDQAFGADPRFWWGHGKLNVCGALSASGAGGGTGPVVITPSADTVPVNATTRFFSCSPTGASIAFHSTNPAVATIDAAGNVQALQLGTALLVATSGTFADTALLVVTDPADLRVALRDVAPATATRSPRGTRIPLLVTNLHINGYESIRLTQLSYRITGRDAGANVLLFADANRNGVIDPSERAIASMSAALTGTPVQIDLALDSLLVPQRDSVQLIAAVELSGAAPNGSGFSAEFHPAGIRSEGTRSRATNRVAAITTPLASSVANTTVLSGEQVFSLSENPVRSDRVVFSFAEAPRHAAIYTLTGRLVTDLKKRQAFPGSIEWNLTNDDGAHVATGAYLAVFQFTQRTVREKIFVLGSRP